MEKRNKTLNLTLTSGWTVAVVILLIIYAIEVAKGQRSSLYFITFMLITLSPNVLAWLLYFYNKESENLKYAVLLGYFTMYTFVLLTGRSALCFTYIFPLLCLLMVYHDTKLIITTSITTICLNMFSILEQWESGQITIDNSRDAEIQIAIILLVTVGSYLATKFFDLYTKENDDYAKTISKQVYQINKISLQTVVTIANAIDARDEYTKGHSSRVADYSALLAKNLGATNKEIEDVHAIALLHDIGKIGIPDSILNKPGKLTDEEYQIMKNHTVIGGNILKDMSILKGIDLGAKHHHERYDGCGYPDRLKGEQIPYVARIISVADAYDAMTSDRIYRKHLDSIIVREEIEKGIGSQFDPAVAQAMIELIDTERVKLSYEDLLNEMYPETEMKRTVL